jgi:hypothetical protein
MSYINPIQPINQTNIIINNEPILHINIIALTYVMQSINPDLYRQSMIALGIDGLLHFINSLRFNYNNDELIRIIEIFHNAFSYILIRDMIIGALNNDNDSHNQLIDINPDLFNIIQTIQNDYYGNIFLTNILDNM